MTVLSSPSRLARAAAAAAASVALAVAALLAPQAASAHSQSSAPTWSCVSATVSDLAAWGYAVPHQRPSGWEYYAAGSGDYLGSDGSAIKSLAERSTGVWTSVPLCS